MRRHAKASSARSTERRPSGPLRGRGRTLALAISILAALVTAVPFAYAAAAPEFLIQFSEAGAGAGQTRNVAGMATNQTNGHVYAVELNNNRISEFTAWGEFVRAFGWGVDDGSPALQTCTTASTCLAGASGSGAGQLAGPRAVAVDSAGNVYVVDSGNNRVEKFDSTGQFLLMFGGEVNKTKSAEGGSTEAERNLCTKIQLDAGNVCGVGTTGTGNGQFAGLSETGAIAARLGTVYVGDENRAQEFSLAGAYTGQVPLAGSGKTSAIALDPSGNLYVVSAATANAVRKVNGTGSVLSTIPVQEPRGIATDSTGNLFVFSDLADPQLIQFDGSGIEVARFGEGEFGNPGGISTNGVGDVYAANAEFSTSYIRAYGPDPSAYEPPPSTPPSIGAQFVSAVDTESATLHAEITPHLWSTNYYLQYGPEDCSSNPCAEEPLAPGTAVPSTRGTSTVTVELTGLDPDTTYHYRFVAESTAPNGGPVFGLDETFVTQEAAPQTAADGRVYEMVSPPRKNGAEVAIPGQQGGLAQVGFSVQPQQAAPDGEAVTYASFTAFAEPEGAPGSSQYLSKRGPDGWTTENLSPRFELGFTRDPLVGFSPDLSHAAVSAFQTLGTPPLAEPAPPENLVNLFTRDNETGALKTLTTVAPPGVESGYCPVFEGASEDFDRIFFGAKAKLNDEAPATTSGMNLYEWTPSAGIKLASVLPNGSAATPNGQTSAGAKFTVTQCDMKRAILRHAVSADGSKMFWTYFNSTFSGGKNPLFARVIEPEADPKTVQLDATQGVAGTGGEGVYRDASVDGSKVFFTDTKKLVPGANANDLYLYDFNRPEGERLTDLTANATAATVQGVLGASEDGSYVYFAATGVLPAAPNARNESPSAGRGNLYVWHQGEGLRFIASLTTLPPDNANWVATLAGSGAAPRTARVSADGRYLVFRTAESLTGYDNTLNGSATACLQGSGIRCAEAFLYEFEDDELTCASCNPSGARPLSSAGFPNSYTPYEQPRYVLNDGRVFFTTGDALDLHDTNGVQDIYEFERPEVGDCTADGPTFSEVSGGCVNLISSGKSVDDSYLLDASADGRDVFISTRQSFVPEDKATDTDVYDARVGGREPTPPQPTCEGEACRGAASTAVPASRPGTASFEGPGDPKASHGCPKGKRQVHRKGKARCVKGKKHPARRHHKRAGHNRRAGK